MADVRLTATNPDDSTVVPVACNAKGELKLEEPIVSPPFDGNLNGDLNVQGEGNFAYTVTRSGRHNISSFLSRQNESNAFGAHYVAYNANSEDPCFAVFHNGSAKFGGDLTIGADEITLNATKGSAKFGGEIEYGDVGFLAAGHTSKIFDKPEGGTYAVVIGTEPFDVRSTPRMFIVILNPGYGASREVLRIDGNYGNASFLGQVFHKNGTPLLSPDDAVLWLEPENDANYTVRTDVDEEGNSVKTRVYNGPSLDIKEEILLIKAVLQDIMEKLRMTPPAGWVWDGSSKNS